jgi:hypothetical protein
MNMRTISKEIDALFISFLVIIVFGKGELLYLHDFVFIEEKEVRL